MTDINDTIERGLANAEIREASEEHRDEFDRALNAIRSMIERDVPSADQAKLLKLTESVTKYSIRYLQAVLSHHTAVDALRAQAGGLQDLQQEVQRADASRRAAHNTVIDSWRIVLRNCQANGVDMEELRPVGARYFMPEDEMDGPKRSEIGKLALVHGLERLMIEVLNDPS